MYTIKRGNEYFCKAVTRMVNNEQIQIITWTSEAKHAAKFTTPEAALITKDALNYDDIYIKKD